MHNCELCRWEKVCLWLRLEQHRPDNGSRASAHWKEGREREYFLKFRYLLRKWGRSICSQEQGGKVFLKSTLEVLIYARTAIGGTHLQRGSEFSPIAKPISLDQIFLSRNYCNWQDKGIVMVVIMIMMIMTMMVDKIKGHTHSLLLAWNPPGTQFGTGQMFSQAATQSSSSSL